jgi:hypothetical protein
MLLNIREDVCQQNIIETKNHEKIRLMLNSMKNKQKCFYITVHFHDN